MKSCRKVICSGVRCALRSANPKRTSNDAVRFNALSGREFHCSQRSGQYFPSHHPFIVKDNNVNMYTNTSSLPLTLNIEGEKHASDRVDLPSFTLSESLPRSTARELLRAKSQEMHKTVFFYHETNPHIGIIGNTQFLLYDHYMFVGPVKGSWPKVLSKNEELLDAFKTHLSCGKGGNSKEEINVWTVAAMIEALLRKEQISLCKFQSTVDDNQIQFRRPQLTKEELIVLEVLAQYSFYRYEIVNW